MASTRLQTGFLPCTSGQELHRPKRESRSDMSHKAPGPRPFSLGTVSAAYRALALFFMPKLKSALRLWIQSNRGGDFLDTCRGAKLTCSKGGPQT